MFFKRKTKPVKKVRKKKPKKEKYVKERSSNPTKKEINRVVAKEFKPIGGQYIVLEAEALLTLKTFDKEGIDLNNVYVPNPFETTFKKIKKFHKNTQQMYVGAYFDRIGKHDVNRETLGGCWLDYCCSIIGNKEMSPFEDIEKLFKYGLFQNNGRLAFTFCQRKPTTTYTNQNMLKVISYTQKMAYKYGYLALLIEEHTKAYKGMFFNMFHIQKL